MYFFSRQWCYCVLIYSEKLRMADNLPKDMIIYLEENGYFQYDTDMYEKLVKKNNEIEIYLTVHLIVNPCLKYIFCLLIEISKKSFCDYEFRYNSKKTTKQAIDMLNSILSSVECLEVFSRYLFPIIRRDSEYIFKEQKENYFVVDSDYRQLVIDTNGEYPVIFSTQSYLERNS